MTRCLRFCALGILVVLLLTGCKIRSDLVINPDGSGTFEYSLAIEDEFLQVFSQGGRDLLSEIETKAGETPFPVETKRFAGAKMKGVAISYEFESIEDLEAKMEVSAGQDDALIKEANVIQEASGGWTFTAVGGSAGTSAQLPIPKEELKKILDITLSVTLPGPNPEGNADRIETHEDSATFTWQIPPGKSALDLRAATVVPTSDGSSVVAAPPARDLPDAGRGATWLVLLAIMAGIAVGTAWFVRTRKTPPPDTQV